MMRRRAKSAFPIATTDAALAPDSNPPSALEFVGKTVVVTGGSRGVGRAVALGFAASRLLELRDDGAAAMRRIVSMIVAAQGRLAQQRS
jgi:hypothetical protein